MRNYFSHDSDARNDEKIIALRMRHGMEGYGIYFAIIERLRESKDYIHVKDYSVISFDLRVKNEIVKSVIEDFRLFDWTEDGTGFYSKSLLERMELKDAEIEKKRAAGRKGAATRWKQENADHKDSARKNTEKNSSAIAVPSEKNSSAIATLQKNIARKESKVNINTTHRVRENFPEIVFDAEALAFLEEQIADWNAIPHVVKTEWLQVPEAIRTSFMHRLLEHGADGIRKAIANVAESEYLKTKPKGYVQTFQWLVSETNFQKILDGTFNDLRKPPATGPPKSGKRTPHVTTKTYDPNIHKPQEDVSHVFK